MIGKFTKGQWKNGSLKNGKQTLPNGDVYEGQFSNDLYHGKGLLTKKEGAIYDGEFEKGERHGSGTQIFGENKGQYVGNWKKNMYHGQGYLVNSE